MAGFIQIRLKLGMQLPAVNLTYALSLAGDEDMHVMLWLQGKN